MPKRHLSWPKRILIDVAGFGLLLLAILLSWVPGPTGIPLFLAGLALLSTHHHWAGRLLHHLKKHGKNLADILFPDHPLIKIAYDLLVVGLVILVILAIGSVTHAVLRTALVALGFLALAIGMLNRKRGERLSRLIVRGLRQ